VLFVLRTLLASRYLCFARY